MAAAVGFDDTTTESTLAGSTEELQPVMAAHRARRETGIRMGTELGGGRIACKSNTVSTPNRHISLRVDTGGL